MSREVVLAVDVGGTSFKGALVSADHRITGRRTRILNGLQGEEAFAALGVLLRELQADAAAEGARVLSAAVIAPGMDESTGRILFAANLTWRDLALRERLEASLGLSVAVGHDVRAAGLAEAKLGAGRGFADVAVVMLGTGIAASLIVRGAAMAGGAGMAGEFGHIPVYPDGEACACGQRGCLEVYASAAGIARRYRAAGGRDGFDAEGIFGRRDQDAVAARICTEAVAALGHALATLTLLVDPRLIVLGGGLAGAGDALLLPVRAAVAGNLAWRAPPEVVLARLGKDAALLGAAQKGFARGGADIS